MGRKIAVHQCVQLTNGQAVLERVAVIGPLRGIVDLAAGEVSVGQHRQRGKLELGHQGVLGPLDHGVHKPLGAAQEIGKLYSSRPPTSSGRTT